MSLAPLDFSLDKPLPQNPEAERSILGSIMVRNEVLDRVSSVLRSEHFYKDAHRTIFDAMLRLSQQGRPIDLITVKEELSRKAQLEQVGGVAYVSSLVDSIPDVGNVQHYADIVREKATLRQLILMGNKVIRAAAESPEPTDVLNMAERTFMEISETTGRRGFTAINEITLSNLTALEGIARAGKLVTGVPTGYDRFNEMTSGFQPQDLVILAARPSMGKTSLMLNIAESIAVPHPGEGNQEKHAVGIFSLEMSKEQIGLRILSSEANVSSQLMRAGILSEKNWRDLAEAAGRISKAPIWVDDTPGIDILEMRSRARQLQREHRLDMIMVDYLQLMTAKGRVESRQQEVSAISRGLKAVAKELNVPLLSLSQLSRRSEQRTGDHRPQLADLRESGAIEQDADLVFFIYRDEVYNRETEDKGIAEIIIAKQRNGPIGDFKLVFRNDITKFFNYAPEPEYIGGGGDEFH